MHSQCKLHLLFDQAASLTQEKRHATAVYYKSESMECNTIYAILKLLLCPTLTTKAFRNNAPCNLCTMARLEMKVCFLSAESDCVRLL